MKFRFLFTFFLIFQVCVITVFSQPHADCQTAIPICFNKYLIPNSIGEGNSIDFVSIGAFSSCIMDEKNSVYYFVKAKDNGLLAFEIIPSNTQTDYDWGVFDITYGGCSNLENNILAGNISQTSMRTGPNGLDSNFCNSFTDSPFGPKIPVQKGHEYLIYVSNYSSVFINDSIDFSLSDSAVLFGNNSFAYNIDTCLNVPLMIRGGLGYDYLWSTGDTTQNIYINNSGLYIVSYSTLCGLSSDTFFVNLTMQPFQNLLPEDMAFCQKDSIVIFPDSGFSNHFWLNNNTFSDSIIIDTTGTVFLKANDSLGCALFDSINIYFSSDLINPEICQVSVNELLHGVDVYYQTFPAWKPMLHYDIYKYFPKDSMFLHIITQNASSAGYYFDIDAGFSHEERYFIMATDTCWHTPIDTVFQEQTIFLTAEYQSATSAYLKWTPYLHADVSKYLVYAGTDLFSMNIIQIINPTYFYAVVSNLTQNTYFRVVAVLENNCCDIDSAYSNIPYYILNETELNLSNCFVYPQIIDDCFKISCDFEYKKIEIYNSSGLLIRKLKPSNYYCINDLEPGIYFIVMSNNEKINTYRILKK